MRHVLVRFIVLVEMRFLSSILLFSFLSTKSVVLGERNPEFRFGLIGKAEFNRLKIENSDNASEVIRQDGAMGAFGLYSALNLGRYWFLDASVLLSRAQYTVNFKRAGAELIDADIRFTQMNLNLNLILNPNSEMIHVFLFGGGQLLYRRWGEERYNNAVVPNSYWPSARILAQAGLGVKCSLGRGFYIQPFAGFRYAVEQQLVYDVSLNQYFAGAVLCYGIKSRIKDRYRKCPVEF